MNGFNESDHRAVDEHAMNDRSLAVDEPAHPAFIKAKELLEGGGHAFDDVTESKGLLETQHAVYKIIEEGFVDLDVIYNAVSRAGVDALDKNKNFVVYAEYAQSSVMNEIKSLQHASIFASRDLRSIISTTTMQLERAIVSVEQGPANEGRSVPANQLRATGVRSTRWRRLWNIIMVVVSLAFGIVFAALWSGDKNLFYGLTAIVFVCSSIAYVLASTSSSSTRRWSGRGVNLFLIALAVSEAKTWTETHSFISAFTILLCGLLLSGPATSVFSRLRSNRAGSR